MTGEGCEATEMAEGREQNGKGADAGAGRDGDEFTLVVRKLELPVRPRGVLAE